MRFDKDGKVILQKIKYTIKHEESIQEIIDKYLENELGKLTKSYSGDYSE